MHLPDIGSVCAMLFSNETGSEIDLHQKKTKLNTNTKYFFILHSQVQLLQKPM